MKLLILALVFFPALTAPRKTSDKCTATQDALVSYVAHVSELQAELQRVRAQLLVCRQDHGMTLNGEF